MDFGLFVHREILMTRSTDRRLLVAVAFVATLFFGAELNAQGRGFRIGNVLQAGGGQGFRLGGPRFGMHFGGGQGASIGGQNFGMRFGNGQGARIGLSNYGMQFGGGQGTQIGRFSTTTGGDAGTYYYGDVQNGVPLQNANPNFASPAGRSVLAPGQPNTNNRVQPTAQRIAPQVNLRGQIRLSVAADVTEPLKYQLNGTDFVLRPGSSVWMGSGQVWKVGYAPKAGAEMQEVNLSESGDFVFKKADDAWVLEKQGTGPVQTTIQKAPTTQSIPTTQQAPKTDSPPSVLIKEDDSTPSVLDPSKG